MAQRAIRFSEATDNRIREAVEKRGFSSPTAFIRQAVEQELTTRQDELVSAEGRLVASIEQVRQALVPMDRFLIHLHHDDGGLHTYMLETQSGRLLPVPGKLHVTKMAPNGTWGVVLPAGLELRLAHLESGEIRTVCGLQAGWSPVRWSANGGEIFVFEPGKDYATGNIIRINVHTGEHSPWLTLHPADTVGTSLLRWLDVTPDGRSYAYTYQQDLGDLYILDGLT